jgi:thymidylate kinase
MKTLILEGIATSGKSTIIRLLAKTPEPNYRLKVVPETKTLMPIIDNTDKLVSIDYLTKLIDKEFSEEYDIIIFDRLYLTHIFRTHSSMADFKVIEDKLREFSTETIFLEVDEDSITPRVAKASDHRDPEWREYIYTKGRTIEEVADYYIQQQQNQLKILQQSTLPYKIFNTTTHQYQTITEDIIAIMNKNFSS